MVKETRYNEYSNESLEEFGEYSGRKIYTRRNSYIYDIVHAIKANDKDKFNFYLDKLATDYKDIGYGEVLTKVMSLEGQDLYFVKREGGLSYFVKNDLVCYIEEILKKCGYPKKEEIDAMPLTLLAGQFRGGGCPWQYAEGDKLKKVVKLLLQYGAKIDEMEGYALCEWADELYKQVSEATNELIIESIQKDDREKFKDYLNRLTDEYIIQDIIPKVFDMGKISYVKEILKKYGYPKEDNYFKRDLPLLALGKKYIDSKGDMPEYREEGKLKKLVDILIESGATSHELDQLPRDDRYTKEFKDMVRGEELRLNPHTERVLGEKRRSPSRDRDSRRHRSESYPKIWQ